MMSYIQINFITQTVAGNWAVSESTNPQPCTRLERSRVRQDGGTHMEPKNLQVRNRESSALHAEMGSGDKTTWLRNPQVLPENKSRKGANGDYGGASVL